MRLPSASQLDRVMACPVGHALPQVRTTNTYATRGTALHAFLHAVRRAGRANALKQVPDEYRADCEAIDVTALPVAGEAEAAFAWDYRTDVGRALVAKGRDYSEVGEHEFCGTADVVDSSGGVVLVGDYKTGHMVVAPDTWQMKALCLFAARAYGCDEAEATIYQIRDSKVYATSQRYTGFEFDAIALDLARLVKRLGTGDYAEGDHCRYCPGFRHCPAKNALIVRPPDLDDVSMIPAAQLGVRYAQIQHAKKALALAEELIEEHAAHEEIPLPNGKTLRLVDDERESIDHAIAYGVILAGWGPELANKAVEQKATKASIKRALNGAHEEAIERIRLAGGVKTTLTAKVKEV